MIENDITIASYPPKQIKDLEEIGLGWSSLFGDINWIEQVKNKLTKASNLFEINRGERRGWDKMFYPEDENHVEKEYLKPVLKSSRDIKSLIAESDGIAFCCEPSKEQLKKMGHDGALEWIEKFEKGFNTKGEPLPESLRRPGIHWHTMLPVSLADIVTSMNPGERLFFAKLKERAFINQRLIRLTKKGEADIDLCHALLNSLVSLFYLEALGFGRGEGALDLSSEKLKNNLFMLNPKLLKQEEKSRIIEKFQPLLKRQILTIPEELHDKDRLEFDKEVLKCFGIEKVENDIRNSLFTLYGIRASINY